MLKYLINGKEFEDKDDVIDYIIDNLDDEVFDDMLDDTHDDLIILGMYYNVSNVLKQVDPVAYRCCKSDYFDSLRDDIKYWLDKQEDVIYGFDIEYIEDEEDGE